MIDLVGDDNTQIPPTIKNELILIQDDFALREKVIEEILKVNKGQKILIFFDMKRDVQKMEHKNKVLALHGDIT